MYTYAAAARSLQSCPTLCDPIDSSPPGSSVHGILPARVGLPLEWVAISFSMCVCVFFFRFFLHIGYYIIVNRVPCAIQ